jgi:hypothetical protein
MVTIPPLVSHLVTTNKLLLTTLPHVMLPPLSTPDAQAFIVVAELCIHEHRFLCSCMHAVFATMNGSRVPQSPLRTEQIILKMQHHLIR